MKHGIFNYHVIKPFEQFGLVGKFWHVHLDTLIYTWAAMLILLILAIIGRIYSKRKLNYVSIIYDQVISFFISTCTESFGFFHYRYFVFIASLFLFTLFCCLTGLIPFLDESTKDLNTTFALGLSSFLYIQYQKIRAHGLARYTLKYFQPVFLLAPINIVGELAKVASMSFRLFGNILGGSIIFGMIIGIFEQKPYAPIFISLCILTITASLLLNKIPVLQKTFIKKIANVLSISVFILVWAQMFFGIFEGVIQAFVLTILTTTYLSMGTVKNEPSKQKES